jgi:predicted ATPase
LEHAIAGEFQMLFVTGEEGIGKSTLLDMFLRRAGADPGIRIASGQCLDRHGAAEPFFPVLVALAELSQQYGRDRFAACSGSAHHPGLPKCHP